MSRKEGRVAVPEEIRRQLRENPSVQLLGQRREVVTTAMVVPTLEGVVVYCRDVASNSVTGFRAPSHQEGYQRLLTRDFSYEGKGSEK